MFYIEAAYKTAVGSLCWGRGVCPRGAGGGLVSGGSCGSLLSLGGQSPVGPAGSTTDGWDSKACWLCCDHCLLQRATAPAQDFGIWERGDKTNQGITELNASSVGMAKVSWGEVLSGCWRAAVALHCFFYREGRAS